MALPFSKIGNYNGAIAYYDKILLLNSTDMDSPYEKGLALYYLGNSTDIMQYMDKVLALDPRNQGALYIKNGLSHQLQ